MLIKQRKEPVKKIVNINTNNITLDKAKWLNIDNNKIIVGLTSYPARINNLAPTLESIFSQNAKIDKIYLVLSIKEFPNLKNDVPEYLLNYTNVQNNFEILFVENNLKQFKKNLPLLKMYENRNDIIIFTIDDDKIYKNNYISTVYSFLIENNKKCPSVITWKFPWEDYVKQICHYNNNEEIRLVGWCEAIIPSFFTYKPIYSLTEEMINTQTWISEDHFITCNLKHNNINFVQFPYNMLISLVTDYKENEIKPLLDKYKNLRDDVLVNNVKNLFNSLL